LCLLLKKTHNFKRTLFGITTLSTSKFTTRQNFGLIILFEQKHFTHFD
jgi:hypothetical protein